MNTAKRAIGVTPLAIAGLLLVALLFNARLAPSHRLSLLYAIPVLLAAHRLTPRSVALVAVLACGASVVSAIIARPSLELWAIAFVALIAIGYLAVMLSVQRQRTAQRAQETEKAQRQLHTFLGMVTHDLGGSMTGVLGYVQLLQRQVDADSPVFATAQSLDRAGKQLQRLLNDLRDAALVGNGRFALAPATMDLVLTVKTVLDQQQTLSPSRHFTLDAPERLCGVWDRQRLSQVCSNLLSNAAKYTPAGADVRVVVSATATEVILSVADQGPGIPHDELARLFQPFSRLERDPRVHGTGLGLYITDVIARAHGGRVWAESCVGAGSTFYVALPLGPAPCPQSVLAAQPLHPV